MSPIRPMGPMRSQGTVMNKMSAIDGTALRTALAQAVTGEVRFERLDRALYSTDASVYQIVPLGVVVWLSFTSWDALGSPHAENKETAIRRMERHGAEVVTTEMVVFEWIETAEHPHFRDAVALVK